MADKTFADVFNNNMFADWEDITRIGKPVIAAVNGFALGGGCELAMSCDIIVCGEGAKFGQPEIKLGVIPGGGGTQRLTRLVGKSKAMELCLTGDMLGAQEAKQLGLVAQVYPDAEVVDKALAMAEKISKYSLPVIQMAKEAVNKSYEMSQKDGLAFERRLFHSAFALV